MRGQHSGALRYRSVSWLLLCAWFILVLVFVLNCVEQPALGQSGSPQLIREYIYMDGQPIAVEENYRTYIPLVSKPAGQSPPYP